MFVLTLLMGSALFARLDGLASDVATMTKLPPPPPPPSPEVVVALLLVRFVRPRWFEPPPPAVRTPAATRLDVFSVDVDANPSEELISDVLSCHTGGRENQKKMNMLSLSFFFERLIQILFFYGTNLQVCGCVQHQRFSNLARLTHDFFFIISTPQWTKWTPKFHRQNGIH